MSNKTFNMSTTDQVETTVPLPHRGLQLGLSLESHYTNVSLSPSPDSPSSISIQSDTEDSISPDINMLESCLNEGSLVDNPHNTALIEENLFCDMSMNLNQTFIATPVHGNVNFWNKNLSLINNQETSTEDSQAFSLTTHDRSNRTVTSPDSSGGTSQLSSCEMSRRGSTENDCCSMSSGEMVIRSNSFCLGDQSLLVVSSLDDSAVSSAAGHPAFSAEANVLSPALPDVCEKSTERIFEENADCQCLSMTFNLADNCELPKEENHMNSANSLVALPSENEGGLLMTFVCERSSDSGKEAQIAGAEAEMLPTSAGVFTPEQGKAFVSTLSAMQDTDEDIHTSTPVPNTGNKIPSLPSFSESPCTGNAGSPGLTPAERQQKSDNTKQHLVVGLPPSSIKAKKMEIRKFPKSDFSYVKSKVVTRNLHKILVPGPASEHKPLQDNVNNKRTEARRGSSFRTSPAKVRSNTTVVSATAKMDHDVRRRANTVAGCLGVKIESSEQIATDRQCKSRASPAGSKRASAVQRSNPSSHKEHTASSQVADSSAQQTGNQTFCFSSPDRSGQTDSKQTPKKGMSDEIEVRSGSSVGQVKPPLLKIRPRCSSESLSSSAKPPKDMKKTLRFSTTVTIPKHAIHPGQTKPGTLKSSSQYKPAARAEATKEPADTSPREVKKISLVTESSKATGASLDESKSRFRGQPSPRQTRLLQTPDASPRPATLSTRQRQGTYRRDEFRVSKAVGTQQSKQKSTVASAASVKPQLNGSQHPQTPTRPSPMGPPPTPASRRPRRTSGSSRSHTEDSVDNKLSEGSGSSQVSGGAAPKPTPFKTFLQRARLIPTPGKSTGPAWTTVCKPAASANKGSSNSTDSLLKRTPSSRLVHLISSRALDKNKPKASSRQQNHQRQTSLPNQSNGPPDVVPPGVAEGERKDERIQQLRGNLAAANCKFEAVTIVLKQTLAERDEATRQCRELSQELVNLRGELVSSVDSSERLEKEKQELRDALETALQKLQEQQQKDLEETEQRLQAFYQAEWDKINLTYQEEADKCKTLMQQQMVELKASHETMKLELESSHAEQLQCFTQQYEQTLEELREIHNQELESLDKTLKDAEAALSGRIEELTAENSALIDKLTAEENKRRELAGQSQKDSHTVYLEQELESLKVVLDIKNKQLHQQEKKLMEIDKLTEKNLKLDEILKKVQQENEDFKARMERHAALSRQLSTEQAMLQESLQKESKVNKRLSMENEELIWKLHNGDLSSPHKVSPTTSSPSHSFSFQSPHSSDVFSVPPASPR